MCFSATASFIAGGTTTGIGALTLKKAKLKSELPLASVPIMFGIQQLIEGVLWLTFDVPGINSILTYAYAFFSHVWWPVFIPIAVFLAEDMKSRKRILFAFIIVGGLVGLYFLFFMITGSAASRITSNSIEYIFHFPYPEYVFILYFIATSLSCGFSSHNIIKFFGAALAISSLIAYHLYTVTFTSVWCFFAAVLSLIIYSHYHFKSKVQEKKPN